MERRIDKNHEILGKQLCEFLDLSKKFGSVSCLIYTTNATEGSNRQLRKVAKSKTLFPPDEILLKNSIWHYRYHEKMEMPELGLVSDSFAAGDIS